MTRFPNINSLADASEDEVLHLWTGLGYYSRARNLLRTAKSIVNDYEGHFPETLEDLQELPGIGRSTAGAILAIAFEKHAVILDGNVKRVLTRLHGIDKWPGEKKVEEKLWQLAEAMTPKKCVADYTQAIMDLGATLCARGKPDCHRCPLQEHCVAHAKGIEKNLPISKPRKVLPIRNTTLLLFQDQFSVLLEKRSPTGVWANLWSFPELQTTLDKKNISASFHFEIKEIKKLEPFRHTFSHFHLDISPLLIIGKRKKTIIQENNFLWYDLKNPSKIGLPAPIKKLFEKI